VLKLTCWVIENNFIASDILRRQLSGVFVEEKAQQLGLEKRGKVPVYLLQSRKKSFNPFEMLHQSLSSYFLISVTSYYISSVISNLDGLLVTQIS